MIRRAALLVLTVLILGAQECPQRRILTPSAGLLSLAIDGQVAPFLEVEDGAVVHVGEWAALWLRVCTPDLTRCSVAAYGGEILENWFGPPPLCCSGLTVSSSW